MVLLKWTDVYGKTFVINPMHIVSVSKDGFAHNGLPLTTAIVNFISDYYMEIKHSEFDKFVEEWYLALNKEK